LYNYVILGQDGASFVLVIAITDSSKLRHPTEEATDPIQSAAFQKKLTLPSEKLQKCISPDNSNIHHYNTSQIQTQKLLEKMENDDVSDCTLLKGVYFIGK
jgi:hypothetical protein